MLNTTLEIMKPIMMKMQPEINKYGLKIDMFFIHLFIGSKDTDTK